MVKYETNNGDLAVATRRQSLLNFAWPWLERYYVAAGRRSLYSLPGICDSHSNRAFCSWPGHDCLVNEVRLLDMAALGIPYCHPTAIVCAVYIPGPGGLSIQPAACI